jgi:SAM-dependent methyltransferase
MRQRQVRDERGDQDAIFAASEADRWFDRNVEALLRIDAAQDRVMRALDLSGISPRRVLEIGAANGFRLAAIAHRYGAETVGVEPSAKALADGRARYPRVTLHQGLADSLPIDGTFDVVIVNFVFHWIGRTRLFRAMAEVDRCVANEGYLVIGDFYPRNLMRTPYHHLPDSHVETFKQDYSEIFVASGLYRRISLLTASHDLDEVEPDVAEEDRTSVAVLQKRVGSLYVPAARAP